MKLSRSIRFLFIVVCLSLVSCSFLGSAWNKTTKLYRKLVYTKELNFKKRKIKINKTEERFALVFASIDEEIERLLSDLKLINRKNLTEEYLNTLKNKYVWLKSYVVVNNKGKVTISDSQYTQPDFKSVLDQAKRQRDIFVYIQKDVEPIVSIVKPFFYNRKLIYLLNVSFQFSALASFYPESKHLIILGPDQHVLWVGSSVNLDHGSLKQKLIQLTKKNIKGEVLFNKQKLFCFVRYIGNGKITYCMVLSTKGKGG